MNASIYSLRDKGVDIGTWCRANGYGWAYQRCQKCDRGSFVFGPLADTRALCEFCR